MEPGILLRQLTPSQIAAIETRAIADITAGSRNLASADFSQLRNDDLAVVFDAIDRNFLNGALRTATRLPPVSLGFRLAKRMTHTGGTTSMQKVGGKRAFEISIAPRVIHETFQAVERASVCGLECENMRIALVRIMQHEMIHLAEFLCWENSSCNASRFRGIVSGLFGHTESRHRMLTPAERSRMTHQVGPGDKVGFHFQGQRLTGVVNRINRRATVLVPSPRGRRYSDGKAYVKYYVPLNELHSEG